MKNTTKLIGVIAIAVITVLAIAACATSGSSAAPASASSTVPGLTITGLEVFNGMRIQAELEEEVYAGDRVDGYTPFRGVRMVGVVIAGGTATLNVWNTEAGELDEDSFTQEVTSTPYTGSGEMTMNVAIWDDGDEVFYWNSSAKAVGQMTVTFTNGAAKGEFTASYVREEEEE